MTHNPPDGSTQRMSDQLADVIAAAYHSHQFRPEKPEAHVLAAEAVKQFLIDSPEEAAKELGLEPVRVDYWDVQSLLDGRDIELGTPLFISPKKA